MKLLLRALPICAALIAGSAYAADPDQHAAHHPAAPTGAATNATDSTATTSPAQECPMMNGQTGQMMGGQGTQGMSGMGQGSAATNSMGQGGMMDGSGHAGMHCMHGQGAQDVAPAQGDQHAQHHPGSN